MTLLDILKEDLQMAEYNALCYKGKKEYTKEYEREREKMVILAKEINKLK